MIDVSYIIRTYNEERYLFDVIQGINKQKIDLKYEILVVDSGSTDKTLEIADKTNCRIIKIAKDSFSFGRSLNLGCEAALGSYLVFLSGHCIPKDEHWALNLLTPLIEKTAVYSYGRQIGADTSKYSECRVFEKYYPAVTRNPQDGFYVNNANAALLREAWRKFQFVEELTGLEDMELAKRIWKDGGKISYIAEAVVTHIHHESFRQIHLRFKREAIALRFIMPEIKMNYFDFAWYFLSAVVGDCSQVISKGNFCKYVLEILQFRFMQYYGTFRGSRELRKISAKAKQEYFYPV